MKIALVTYQIDFGGVETFLFRLANYLLENDHQVTFVVSNKIGRWHKLTEQRGYQVVSIIENKWQSPLRHAKRLANALSGFDAVILNHSSVGQSILGLLPTHTARISILHNIHPEIFSIGLSNIDNLDSVCAVSEGVMRAAFQNGVSSRKLSYINHGIEVPVQFLEKDNDGPLRLIFIGRILHSQKGVLHLPGILQILNNHNIPFHIDIIGDGPDKNELSFALTKILESDKYHLHGSLTNEQAQKLLLCADVLLLPSYYEGFGVVLLEAMANGVIPVATDLTNVTDKIISHGNTGFLVPVGNEEVFASYIIKLHNDRELKTEMSKKAWEVAKENYNVQTMGRSYLTLIEGIRSANWFGNRPGCISHIQTDLLSVFPFLPKFLGKKIDKVLRRFQQFRFDRMSSQIK